MIDDTFSLYLSLFFILSLASITLIWWVLRKVATFFPLTGFLLLVSFIVIRRIISPCDSVLKSGPSGVNELDTGLGGIGW